MAKIIVRRTSKNRAKLIQRTIKWCVDLWGLWTVLEIRVGIQHVEECYGTCDRNEEHCYRITVDPWMSPEDLVSTLIHEMVHVRQWETSNWTDDGEEEAERVCGVLSDIFWSEYLEEKI